MDEAARKTKFVSLQKHLAFLKSFRKQAGNSEFVEKNKKCEQLVKLLQGGFKTT